MIWNGDLNVHLYLGKALWGIGTFATGSILWIVYKFFNPTRLTKENSQILFIDDKDVQIVKNLKKAGWSVELKKDISDIHASFVKRANVIFVDYRGVGKTLGENDEGFGLARALKRGYGDKKRVVIYSGEVEYKSDFMKRVRDVDDHLPKDSNTEEFIYVIEEQLGKIKSGWLQSLLP